MNFGACDWLLVRAPSFGPTEGASPLVGRLEVGQTHIFTAVGENRIHEELAEGRETVVLFTPATTLQGTAWTLILSATAANGHVLGTLPLVPPSNPVALFEQRWASVNLDVLGGEGERLAAWHTVLPAHWIAEGLTIRLGKVARPPADGSPVAELLEHTFTGLAAPHTFTFHRLPVYLWGNTSAPLPTMKDSSGDASKLAVDMFAVHPFKELRWVDIPPYPAAGSDQQGLPTRTHARITASAPLVTMRLHTGPFPPRKPTCSMS